MPTMFSDTAAGTSQPLSIFHLSSYYGERRPLAVARVTEAAATARGNIAQRFALVDNFTYRTLIQRTFKTLKYSRLLKSLAF